MSQKAEGESDAQLLRLRRRIDELERQVERHQEIVARHEAMLRRMREFSARDRRRGAGTPCAYCRDGVLEVDGQCLVCTSCEYVRYL